MSISGLVGVERRRRRVRGGCWRVLGWWVMGIIGRLFHFSGYHIILYCIQVRIIMKFTIYSTVLEWRDESYQNPSPVGAP